MSRTRASGAKPQDIAMTEDTATTSEADFDDTIARNRAMPVVDKASIPRPPEGFRSSDPEVRRKRLRRLDATMVAEALDSLQEIDGRGAQLREDLGKHTPDPAKAHALFERLRAVSQAAAVANTLSAYLNEVLEITSSDVVVYLEAVNKEYQHAADHEPQLAEHYTALIEFFETRSRLISEGIAQAKSARTSGVSPAPAGEPPAKG